MRAFSKYSSFETIERGRALSHGGCAGPSDLGKTDRRSYPNVTGSGYFLPALRACRATGRRLRFTLPQRARAAASSGLNPTGIPSSSNSAVALANSLAFVFVQGFDGVEAFSIIIAGEIAASSRGNERAKCPRISRMSPFSSTAVGILAIKRFAGANARHRKTTAVSQIAPADSSGTPRLRRARRLALRYTCVPILGHQCAEGTSSPPAARKIY